MLAKNEDNYSIGFTEKTKQDIDVPSNPKYQAMPPNLITKRLFHHISHVSYEFQFP